MYCAQGDTHSGVRCDREHRRSRRRLNRWRSTAGLLVAIAFVVVVPSVVPVYADDPILKRGFDPNNVYHLGDFDSINAMNGNLTVRIPLGQEYKSSGTLSYAFVLTYNSNIWDYVSHQPINLGSNNGPLETPIDVDNGVQFSLFDVSFANPGDNTAFGATESIPTQRSNAGVGWSLSLGDMRNGVTYVSENGAEHRFSKTLQSPGPANGPQPFVQQNDFALSPAFTTDGSYLRLTDLGLPTWLATALASSDNSFNPDPEALDERQVQFPDGLQKRFYCDETVIRDFPNLQLGGTNQLGPCTNLITQRWLLDQIADPFGNVLAVTRSAYRVGDSTTDPMSGGTPVPSAFRPMPGMTWRWTFSEYSTGTSGYADAHAINGPPRTLIRQHYVDFAVTRAYELAATRVVVAAPPDAQNNPRTAEFDFTYISTSTFRDYGSMWGDPQTLVVPYDPQNNKLDISLLANVSQPAAAGPWSFTYTDETTLGLGPPNPAPANNQLPDLLPWGWPSRGNGTLPNAQACTTTPNVYCDSWRDGRLTGLTLPTGGSVTYTYDMRGLPIGSCYKGSHLPLVHTVVGVASRQISDINHRPVGSPWLYVGATYFELTASDTGCAQPPHLLSTVIDPLGVATVTAFSMAINPSEGPPTESWQYGLPITLAMTEDTYLHNNSTPSPIQRYWSAETYQCNRAQLDAITTPADLTAAIQHIPVIDLQLNQPNGTQTCGLPFQTVFRAYDDSMSGCDAAGSCFAGNPRLMSEKTVYYTTMTSDSGTVSATSAVNSWASKTFADYDGLGHYRTTVDDGGVGGMGSTSDGDVRTALTRFNPNLVYNNTSGQFSVVSKNPLFGGDPQITGTWLLDLYDLKSVTESGAPGGTAITEYAFDPPTGFLTGVRMLSDSTGGDIEKTTDLRTSYTRTAQAGTLGNVSVMQQFFGGDGGDQSTPQYTITEQFVAGTMARQEYDQSGCSTVAIEVPQANDVDIATGAVLTSTDASGATTGYGYDVLGRLTSLMPPGLASTTYIYTAPDLANMIGAHVETVTQDSTGVLGDAIFDYDHLGRVVAEHRRKADGWSLITHSFKANGWRASDSTEGPDNVTPAGFTNYNAYDPFGRPVVIVHPDYPLNGAKTTFEYGGVTHTGEKTWGLAIDGNLGGSATVERDFDRQNRLVKLTDFSASNTGSVGTTYQYDVLGHLSASDTGTDNEGDAEQVRSWRYDNRGLLLSHTEPELGSAMANYGNYDARGHALRMFMTGAGSSSPTPFDLTYAFDGAERLVLVAQQRSGTSGPSVLKKYEYYPLGGAPSLSATKLKSATRMNHIPNPYALTNTIDVGVTEAYRYDSTTGLLSAHTVACATSAFSTSVGYTYDGLGNITSIAYPAQAPAPATIVGPPRTVWRAWANGELTSIFEQGVPAPVYATQVRYFPNGLISDITFGAGGPLPVLDVATNSPVNLPRASALTATGQNVYWSQTYSYDAVGHVQTLSGAGLAASAAYTYDPVGRLVSTSLGESGSPQRYSYDRYGNLTSAGLAIDSATNRVSGPSVMYDLVGDLTSVPDLRSSATTPPAVITMAYDALGLMTSVAGAGIGRVYLYDPSDQRVALVDYASDPLNVHERWAARDQNARVIREFDRTNNVWTWLEDYVYGPIALLATVESGGGGASIVHHIHGDQIGTPRVTTNALDGTLVDSRTYAPFGDEIEKRPNTEHIAFAGLERDYNGSKGRDYGDMDYCHARYYFPALGRFLSRDPVEGRPEGSQSWNRYVYVGDEPVTSTDPTGRVEGPAGLNNQLSQSDAMTDAYYRFVPPELIALGEAWLGPVVEHPFADPKEHPLQFVGDAVQFGAALLPEVKGGTAPIRESIGTITNAADKKVAQALQADANVMRAATDLVPQLQRAKEVATVLGEGMGRVDRATDAMGSSATSIRSFLGGIQWSVPVQGYFNASGKGVVLLLGRDGRLLPSTFYAGEIRSLAGTARNVIDLSGLVRR